MKKKTEEMKDQINESKIILSAVYKDKIPEIKAYEVKANGNKAI